MPLQQNPLLQPTPWRLLRAVVDWPLASQHTARRNALVASTALTQRRRELRDVEQFLVACAERPDPAHPGAETARHRA